jgi:hypothetical protein
MRQAVLAQLEQAGVSRAALAQLPGALGCDLGRDNRQVERRAQPRRHLKKGREGRQAIGHVVIAQDDVDRPRDGREPARKAIERCAIARMRLVSSCHPRSYGRAREGWPSLKPPD